MGAGKEKVTHLRNQTAEAAREAVQAGLDATSNGLEQAADAFDRALGFSGDEGKRLAQRSTANIEAVTRCGRVLSEAAQDLSREWVGIAQRQVTQNLESMSTLASCRSVQDFATVQSDLLRARFAQMVEDARHLAERSIKAAHEANNAIRNAGQGNAEPVMGERRA